MFNIIVYSKDRACQLDLFLRSFYKYFKNSDDYLVKVIYTYSKPSYKDGYRILRLDHPSIEFIEEQGRSFKQLTEGVIDSSNPYTVFFVDDNIFKAPFDPECKEMGYFKDDTDILCLSLRLYSGINYCYTIPCDSPAPNLSDRNIWQWKGLPGDWGYPMSLDGHIFRTCEILPLMSVLYYHTPNTLEGIIANYPLQKSKMICLDESPIVNNPCNKVQIDNGNHCGDMPADVLNSHYINGKIISMSNIDGIKNTAPHQEIEVILENLK